MSIARVSLVVALISCTEPPADNPPAAAGPAGTLPTTAPASAAQDSIIATRTVIFMHATPADFDSLRARYSEDDFAVIADDAMWYRATAYEYLEKLQLPVRQVEGKQSFTFRVHGAPRLIDFRQHEWLDVIVLYEPDREPRVIAPVDVHSAAEYFGVTASLEE